MKMILKEVRIRGLIFILILALALVLPRGSALATPCDSFSWSGLEISDEGLGTGFLPSGTAVFDITGSTLTLTLTNTTSQSMLHPWQVLTGFTWDIAGTFTGSLDVQSAMVNTGSDAILIAANGSIDAILTGDDVSAYWGFDDNSTAGLGSYVVGAMGTVNFVSGALGTPNIIDDSVLIDDPLNGSFTSHLSGVNWGLLGTSIGANTGFANQDPYIQNSVVFTWNIVGDTLECGEILNGQPLFGSKGAPLVPEPTSLLLLGIGLAGLFGAARRRLDAILPLNKKEV